jgi:hypothetical protein
VPAGPVLRLWHKAVVAGVIAGVAMVTFRASDPPAGFLFSDFLIAYYPAGQAVLEDPQRLEGLLEKGVRGFVNLPVVAWLFAPLAALPQGAAILVFTLLGVAAAVAAWWLLCRVARLGVRESCLLGLLFAANGPLLYSLKEGNTSHLVLLGLVAGLALLRDGRHAAAGAVLGACAVIKPPLALFGLYFLLRRDRAGLAGFASAGAGAVLASLLLAGWTLNLHWFEFSVLKFSTQWLAAYNVQSLPAFVLRLAPDSQQFLHEWTAIPEIGAGQRLAGNLLRAAVVLSAAVAWWRAPAFAGADPAREAKRRDLQFLLVVCLALVASPLSWSHYYAWLLVPAAFILGPHGLRDGRWPQALACIAIVLATALVRPLAFGDGALAAAYRAFGVSHLLLAGLLAFGLVAARLAAVPPLAGDRRAQRHGTSPAAVAGQVAGR